MIQPFIIFFSKSHWKTVNNIVEKGIHTLERSKKKYLKSKKRSGTERSCAGKGRKRKMKNVK